MMKKLFTLLLLGLMLTNTFTFAQDKDFEDVSPDHWAYEAIQKMSDAGIVSGYSDNTFRPDAPITRGEFAKVMVLALDLEVNSQAQSTFIDMTDDHWVVPYVDVAKKYLTGYTSAGGTKFKPDDYAVREDMAVALVHARGLRKDSSDLEYLKAYGDQAAIHENFRQAIATAIKHEMMVGSVEDGVKVFKPNDVLTRAEAAMLLTKISESQEEKIILEASDVTLKITESSQGLVLVWDAKDKEGLKGYKVVASSHDKTPIYPQDGYIHYISDIQQTTISLSGQYDNHHKETPIIKPGDMYYFSITALYDTGNRASNSVYVKYPGQDCEPDTLVLEGYVEDGVAKLSWSSDFCQDVSGFKLVASKNDSTPRYPENGYYTYLSGSHHSEKSISAGAYYNKGDFNKFEVGETYNFAVIAFVGDQQIPSNTLKLTFDDLQKPTVKLQGTSLGDRLILEWTDENDAAISGFKLVASQSDTRPMYPEDGYYKYIDKGSDQRVVIDLNDGYNGGDINSFKAGQTYHFSVIALVGDEKIPSNTLSLSFDEAAVVKPPEVTLKGYADGPKLVLEWDSSNEHDVEGYKVVASKYDSTPMYSENGYYKYISAKSDEKVIIYAGDAYNNGDFETFKAGETYYFSITSIYSGGKEASNTIKLKIED